MVHFHSFKVNRLSFSIVMYFLSEILDEKKIEGVACFVYTGNWLDVEQLVFSSD